jgi:signal transduction histidine kinase
MMQPFFRTIAITLPLALVGLLTWLLVRSLGPDEALYTDLQRSSSRVALGEAALRRDVLMARAGLLHDYDPLVDDIVMLRHSAMKLGGNRIVQRLDPALAAHLSVIVDTQEQAVESFKTDNALLQNSMAYFDLLSSHLTNAADARLATSVAALGNGILHLTRDSSSDVQNLARMRVEAVSALIPAATESGLGSETTMLVAHGRLLLSLLPSVDSDLRTLFGAMSRDLRETLLVRADMQRRLDERRAGRSRVTLYGVAMALLALLARAGLQLWAGMESLRRRADVEHAIAGLSMHFILYQPESRESLIGEALAALGPAFGADRAYAVLEGDPAPIVEMWLRPGIDRPDGCQAALKQLPAALSKNGEVTHIATVKHMPRGTLREILNSLGAVRWTGIVLRTQDGKCGVICFDGVSASRDTSQPTSDLLRMAGHVLSNALERRQAELARAELEARVLRARRLEALGIFASGIAHNFNNVIGAVLGHAEMALEHEPTWAPSNSHLQEIHRAGERARELVRRILEFGTRAAASHETVSIDQLVEETVSMLTVSLSGRVQLDIRHGAHGAFVVGEAAQLQQVLLNLVRNAAEAMQQEGVVGLHTDLQLIHTSRALSHGQIVPGQYVRVQVADTGPGMDAATLGQIFQPFFTTRPEGTGLGLATVREIVQDHRGFIDVRSARQQGSVFAIWLPQVAPPTVAEATSPLGSGQPVMIISGDEAGLLHDEEMIAALGYEPIGISRADAALNALRREPGRFGVILMDPPLPDMETDQLLAAIGKTAPACKLILISSVAGHAFDRDDFATAWEAVFHRPLRSNAVATALHRCLSRQPWNSVNYSKVATNPGF